MPSDKDPSNFNSAEAIVNLWQSSVEDGLVDKELHPDIPPAHRADLMKLVQAVLDTGKKFKKDDEKHTKQVARDLGQICRMLTKGPEIAPKTFSDVLALVREDHEVCRGIFGGVERGLWCGGAHKGDGGGS